MGSEEPQVFSLDHIKANLAQVIAAGEVAPATDECHWCHKQCGGTCLGVNNEHGSVQMKTDDPAYWMLKSGHTSTPTVHRDGCYICEDPEFAQMGMSLCKPCPQCTGTGAELKGHVAADDEECDDCGFNLRVFYEVGENWDEYRKVTAS